MYNEKLMKKRLYMFYMWQKRDCIEDCMGETDSDIVVYQGSMPGHFSVARCYCCLDWSGERQPGNVNRLIYYFSVYITSWSLS